MDETDAAQGRDAAGPDAADPDVPEPDVPEPGAEPPPTVTLERWEGTWDADDAFAGLKTDVVTYGHLDPLVTLRGLSEASGLPIGALVRYVLARWAAGGSEGVLELGVSGVDHLERLVREAEETGTDEARRRAYLGVRDVVTWLRAGIEVSPDP